MTGRQKFQPTPRASGSTTRRVPLTEAEVLALPASVAVEDAAKALNVGEDKVREMLGDPESGLRPVSGVSRPLRATRRSIDL